MSAATPAAPLGAPLDRWFTLLDGQDFRVGVRERLLVQSLLAQLAARGELGNDLHATLSLAAPLLCTTAEQQRRYDDLLRRFIAGGGGAAAGDERPAPRHPRGPAPRFGTAVVAACWLLALLVLWWAAVLRMQAPAVAPVPVPPPVASSSPNTPPGVPAAPAFWVPPLPLPLQPGKPPAWSTPLRIAVLALGAASVLLLAATLRRRRRDAEATLEAVRTDEDLVHHRLHEAEPVDVSPHPVLARAVGRVLRQRVAGDARVLDGGATLRATIAAAGLWTPRWRGLQRTPEYLVLVDTRHPADHYAAAAQALIDALTRAGVALQVWAYDTTPAAGCWAPGAVGNAQVLTRQRVPVATLLTRAAGARLLVFGAAEALVDESTGALPAWAAPLHAVAERAWFTPVPVHAWSAPEAAADAAGFLVLPLQQAALVTLAAWLSSGRLSLSLDADTPTSFPARLRGPALDWVTRTDAPPPEVVADLMLQLRRMLGATRMQWLAACAIHPALTPPLTLALGAHLVADPRGLALGLAALSALPWFRHGRMPAWLRTELLAELAPDLRQALEARVQQRLERAVEGADQAPLLADIATRRRRLWSLLTHPRGPVQDVVLAEFLRPGLAPPPQGLGSRLSPAVRRRLFKDGDPEAGLRNGVLALPAACALLAVLAATPLWSMLVGTVPQPALAALQGAQLGSIAAAVADDGYLAALGEDRILYIRTLSGTRSVAALHDFPGGIRTSGAYTPTGAEARLAAERADGLRLDVTAGTLRLRDAQGRDVGAPLDTGGVRVQLAGFTPSGSRVVALLEGGRLQSWGRPWPEQTVAFVGCNGVDPAAAEAGLWARQLVASDLTSSVGVETYQTDAWVQRYTRDLPSSPPAYRTAGVGGDTPDRVLAANVIALLARSGGLGWSPSPQDGTVPGIHIGACASAAAAATAPAAAPPAAPASSASAARASNAAATAAQRPVISIQIADELQRPLARLLAQTLQGQGMPVAGIEYIGAKAPATPEVRVQGNSNVDTALRVARTLLALMEADVRTERVQASPSTDTYEVWFDPAVCVSRRVAGCDGKAGPAVQARLAKAGIAQQAQTPPQTPAKGDPAPARTRSPQAQQSPVQQSPVQQSPVEQFPVQQSPVQSSPSGLSSQPVPSTNAAGAGAATTAAFPMPAGGVNAATLELIARYEGLRRQPVTVGGRMEIGYGHVLTAEEQKTQRVRIGSMQVDYGGSAGLDPAAALALLAWDLVPWQDGVNRLLTRPLGENQRGALVSLAYNMGLGNLTNSSLIKAINAGDFQAVPAEFRKWSIFAGGTSDLLRNRRNAEIELWNRDPVPTATGSTNPNPASNTNANSNVAAPTQAPASTVATPKNNVPLPAVPRNVAPK